MDFVHEQQSGGRSFQVLTLIAQWRRESVLLEADLALSGRRVVDALERWAQCHQLSKAITIDRGTELTSKVLDEWAYRRGV